MVQTEVLAVVRADGLRCLIVVGAAIILAVSGVIVYLVRQARQDRPGRAIAAPPARQLPAGTERRQLETGDRHLHIHLHGTDPAEVAALIRRIGDEDI